MAVALRPKNTDNDPSLRTHTGTLTRLLHSWQHPSIKDLKNDHHCSFCHEPYGMGEHPELLIQLPCGHILGQGCILRRLKLDDLNTRIWEFAYPFCRRSFLRTMMAPMERNAERLEHNEEVVSEDHGVGADRGPRRCEHHPVLRCHRITLLRNDEDIASAIRRKRAVTPAAASPECRLLQNGPLCRDEPHVLGFAVFRKSGAGRILWVH